MSALGGSLISCPSASLTTSYRLSLTLTSTSDLALTAPSAWSPPANPRTAHPSRTHVSAPTPDLRETQVALSRSLKSACYFPFLLALFHLCFPQPQKGLASPLLYSAPKLGWVYGIHSINICE